MKRILALLDGHRRLLAAVRGCERVRRGEQRRDRSRRPAEPGPNPFQFPRLWAEDDAACGQLTHHSRLTITANSVRYPAFVLAVESVTQPIPNALAVKGFSKQTKAPTEAHFSIDATGNILTDEAGGGTVRVRCV